MSVASLPPLPSASATSEVGATEEVFESPDEPAAAPALPTDAAAAARVLPVADVVEHALRPSESFEVFMGRRYDPAGGPAFDADAALVEQAALTPGDAAFDALAARLSRALDGAGRGGAPAPPPRRLESPLQRYARLLEGVAELQGELRAVAAADARRAPGSSAVDRGAGVFRLVDEGAGAVAAALARMERDVAAADAALPALPAAPPDAAARPAAAVTTRDALRGVRAQLAAVGKAQAAVARAGAAVEGALAALGARLDALIGDGGGEEEAGALPLR